MNSNIKGFMSEEDSFFLYASVLFGRPKSILEIGHYLGKSTAAICEAIQDTGIQTRFDSFDFPFQSTEAFEKYYSLIQKRKIHATKDYSLLLDNGLTFTQIAHNNLENIGLAKYVNLMAKDFRESRYNSYDLIFADVLHDREEIIYNLASILNFGNKETTYLFDDMKEQNIQLIESCSKLKLIKKIGKVGAFRISRS
jgi:predicted O-methyltransferase YrrM